MIHTLVQSDAATKTDFLLIILTTAKLTDRDRQTRRQVDGQTWWRRVEVCWHPHSHKTL